MVETPFPTRPGDVVPLTVDEFRIDREHDDGQSLDEACTRFHDDLNRALVWLIRLAAVQALNARPDVVCWRRSALSSWRDICEVAASFELNQQWEFDVADFCCAVDALASARAGRQQS